MRRERRLQRDRVLMVERLLHNDGKALAQADQDAVRGHDATAAKVTVTVRKLLPQR